MKAVIQAGGKGTRISEITGDVIPKPMLEISGYPILYHQMMNLKKNGITDITIIIGHLGNVIKDYFKDGKELGLNISYVEEDPQKPLGTAGSLYFLKDKLKENFVFLLADVFIDIDFEKMEQYHIANNADVTLLTHPNGHPFDSDLVVEEGGVVKSFDYKTNDRTKYNYSNLVNAGIMIFSPSVFLNI
ncbi:MAG: nucleotidyltransferase family protein [Clostridium sp.]|nr:MAG: nucleotidyltransferase family protein [Clostridium sp.]